MQLSFQGDCPLMLGSVPLMVGSGRNNGNATAYPLFSKKQSKGEVKGNTATQKLPKKKKKKEEDRLCPNISKCIDSHRADHNN